MIDNTAIETLRSQLTTATVYVPGSVNYRESIVRWSDTGIKHAVWTRRSDRVRTWTDCRKNRESWFSQLKWRMFALHFYGRRSMGLTLP